MSDYTPTIEDVRNHYAYGCGPEHTWAESREDFDRWLAEHDRQVAERAWDAAIQHQWAHRPIGNRSPHNPYRVLHDAMLGRLG